MALNGVEIVIITVMAVVAAAWTLILLFDRTGVSRRPVFSALVLVILGLLGVVFYGIYEDKSNLWWIIPTVGISLITLILVFRIPFLRGRQKILQDETRQEEIRQQVISENSYQDFAIEMFVKNTSLQLKKVIKDVEYVRNLYLRKLNRGEMSRQGVIDDANNILQDRVTYRGVIPRDQIKSSRKSSEGRRTLAPMYTEPPSRSSRYRQSDSEIFMRIHRADEFPKKYEREVIPEEFT
jgi:hypothetical protein